MFIAKSRRKIVKVETRITEIMTKSTFGLNGNLKYPETTLKIRKMCGYFANHLENDMKFSPQTSSDFAHAQTLFSSVVLYCSVQSTMKPVESLEVFQTVSRTSIQLKLDNNCLEFLSDHRRIRYCRFSNLRSGVVFFLSLVIGFLIMSVLFRSFRKETV